MSRRQPVRYAHEHTHYHRRVKPKPQPVTTEGVAFYGLDLLLHGEILGVIPATLGIIGIACEAVLGLAKIILALGIWLWRGLNA